MEKSNQVNNQAWLDVAHLYIGIDIQYPEVFRDGKFRVAKLTGISREAGMETTYKRRERSASGTGFVSGDCLDWKPNGNHNSDATNTRPFLRDLQDITEEEAKEFCELAWGDGLKNLPDDHFENGYKESLFAERYGDDSTSDMGHFLGNPLVYPWLLKHHFDLFGLLEAGIAIRETTKSGK